MRFCLAFCACLLAQTPVGSDEVSLRAAPYSPVFAGATIRTQVDLIEVPVVVRSGKGAAIPGLTRDDFEVFDAGKKQEISSFSVEMLSRPAATNTAPPSAAPSQPSAVPSKPAKRFIALVLDDINSSFGDLRRAKSAAEKFVSESLAAGDLAGIFTTALQENVTFTADPETLKKAIEAVTPHPRYRDDKGTCPVIRAFEAYLISNGLDRDVLEAKASEFSACMHGITMDAAVRGVTMLSRVIWENAKLSTVNTLDSISEVVKIMGRIPGERIVLLTSSGFFSGEQEIRMQAISTAALHSGVIINSLDLKGLYTIVPGGEAAEPRGLGVKALERQTRTEEAKDDGLSFLASATGGQFFSSNNNVLEGLHRLASVPDVVYVLGFSAGGVPHDGKYHPLKVRLTGGHHGTVQARMGYTAPPKELPADVAREAERDRILLGSEAPADVAARVTTELGSDNGPKLAIQTWVGVKELNFEKKDDRRSQRVTVIAALLDSAGDFVVGRQAEVRFALKDSGFAALESSGVTVALSLHAPPGPYTLRVLVQESLTGKLTAVSRRLQLH